MYFSTITPQEASEAKPLSLEEKLHKAVNTLLCTRYVDKAVLIYQEDIEDLIGSKRWNVGEHPRTLALIVTRYANAGWSVIESSINPHRRCWLFTPQTLEL